MKKIVEWFRSTKATSEAITLGKASDWLLASENFRLQLLQGSDHLKAPGSIHGHGFKVYSQSEEDGLIEYILGRVGTGTRAFVEFGSGEGFENNSIYLLMKGWSGLWIEGDPQHAEIASGYFRRLVDSGRLRIVNDLVSPQNIETIMRGAGVPADLDMLSIDIDGNDYWVWRAIESFRPRLVVMEYNAGLGPSAEWVMKFDPNHRWNGGRYFGASLKSFELLGTSKGYRLVGCNLTGSNAFFVRSDLADGLFPEPFDSEHHYQPARYWLRFSAGHPAEPREVESFPEPADAPALSHAVGNGMTGAPRR